jgi:hypothetical protein
MSDMQKPPVLTILAVIAAIIGFFSLLRGGLMLFNSIRQLSAGFGGVIELIIGLLSAAVGVLAIASGVAVLRKKPGCLDLMKKYAIGITAYQIIWIIYAVASGRIVGWGSVLLDIIAGIGTFIFIITNMDREGYSLSSEKPDAS